MTIVLQNGVEIFLESEISNKGKCRVCMKEIWWGNFVESGKYTPLSKDKNGKWIVHSQINLENANQDIIKLLMKGRARLMKK